MEIREYTQKDLPQLTKLWNEITEDGSYFPGEEILSQKEAAEMFAAQTAVMCAVEEERILGFYILHPNNVGRCAHVANASYGVQAELRGKGVGRALVENSLKTAREKGFRGLQYNAVVATNTTAIHLYESIGFERIGMIRGGYRDKNGVYQDMYIFYYELVSR